MCVVIQSINQAIRAPIELSNQLSQWSNNTSEWGVNGKVHYVWLIPVNFLLNVANCLLAPIIALVSFIAASIFVCFICGSIKYKLLFMWLFSVSLFCIVDMFISSLARIVFPCCQELKLVRENSLGLLQLIHSAVWQNVNQANTYGYTPLTAAVLHKQVAIVELLLQHGADVNLADEHGYTPLAHAALLGCTAEAEKLLEYNANIDLVNRDGRTPLSLAICRGRFETVELLLQHGARVQEDNGDKPSTISRLKSTRIASRKALKELIERYSTDAHQAFNYAKQYNQFKLITHAFELTGLIDFQHYRLKAGGSAHEMAAATISKSIERFSAEFPELLDLQSSRQLAQGLLLAADHKSLTADTYLERIKSGEPTFILTGFIGHSIAVLIWHDLFVICNREGKDMPVLQMGRINNTKLDQNCIQELLNLSDQNEEAYNAAMSDAKGSSLLHYLEFTTFPNETTLTLLADIQMQIAPNCSWASVEGALKTFLLLSKLNKPSFQLPASLQDQLTLRASINTSFQTWLLFQKTILVNNYIQNGWDPTQILPDIFGCLRTDQQMLPQPIQKKMTGRINALMPTPQLGG